MSYARDGGAVEKTGLVTAGQMHGRAVLDVRQAAEYAAGHDGLAVLAGGTADWAAATGRPLQEGA